MVLSEPPLRLLYVIDSLAPGGAERSLAALAPQYRDLGIELTVAVLTDRGGLADDIRASGGEVVVIPGAGHRATQLRSLVGCVRDQRPHLVHTTLFEADIIGRIAARVARVPVVSSLVNESYGPEHAAEAGVRQSRLRAARAIDATTARLTVRMHAVSERVKDVMAPRLHYPAARIDVVPRGRDPRTMGDRTQARREAARRALDLDDHDTMVLCVARHEPQKALDGAVRALREVRGQFPGARLVIAGRVGTATPLLERTIDDAGLNDAVLLLGERDDVPELLCAADVFVLCSQREGMPGSVIEAMALATPVVATDLPQVREVTGSDGARLLRNDNPHELAMTILETLQDRNGTDEQVERALVRYRTFFTTERTAQGMSAFYERAIGPR